MTPDGFSDTVPGLRLAWDATTLSIYMRDPFTYYWQYVEGYRALTKPLPLVWGTLWHRGCELHRRNLLIMERNTALRRAIDELYPEAQRELEPYTTYKDYRQRSLRNLIRSLIWWEDEYRDRPWRTAEIEPGLPALEYHYIVPAPFKASTGEDYLLCGSLDEIAYDEDGMFAIERKHTTKTLGDWYFLTYDPNMQTYWYDLIVSFLLPHNPLRGIVVEACQTAVEFSRFAIHEIIRSSSQREHWEQVIRYWIGRAERDALDNSWQFALNTESSTYGSHMKDLEKRSPRNWRAILETEMVKQPVWNPLEPK